MPRDQLQDIDRLVALFTRGALTADEFDSLKAQLLVEPAPQSPEAEMREVSPAEHLDEHIALPPSVLDGATLPGATAPEGGDFRASLGRGNEQPSPSKTRLLAGLSQRWPWVAIVLVVLLATATWGGIQISSGSSGGYSSAQSQGKQLSHSSKSSSGQPATAAKNGTPSPDGQDSSGTVNPSGSHGAGGSGSVAGPRSSLGGASAAVTGSPASSPPGTSSGSSPGGTGSGGGSSASGSGSGSVTSVCLVVNSSTGDNYSSLTAAEGAASSGATLWARGSCTGLTEISKNLTILGQQPEGYSTPSLDGAGTEQVLTVGSGVTLNLEAITVTGGDGTDGGAIENSGTLNIIGATISNSSGAYGGAIYNSGTLNMLSGTISDNTVVGGTRMAHAHDGGGGIYNNGGTISISGGTITNNSAKVSGGGAANTGGDGGGVLNSSGSVDISGGSISNNTAAVAGGGIANYGTVDITGGTISTNTSSGYGGGIYNTGTLELNGGSVSNNTATTSGGGVYNSGGTLSGDSTTMSGNKPQDVCPAYGSYSSTGC